MQNIVNEQIEATIATYNITSEGDTKYILRVMIQNIFEEMGRRLHDDEKRK